MNLNVDATSEKDYGTFIDGLPPATRRGAIPMVRKYIELIRVSPDAGIFELLHKNAFFQQVHSQLITNMTKRNGKVVLLE